MFGFGEPKDSPAPPVSVPGEGQLRVVLVTTLGEIEGILFEAEAVRTVANFVALALGTLPTAPGGTPQRAA